MAKGNHDGRGTIYLLHFDKGLPRVGHGDAQHYLGWTAEENEGGPLDRVNEHLAGQGNPIVRAALARGANVECVRTWRGDRLLESNLKKRKNNRGLCPLCLPALRERKAELRKRRRRDGMER